MVPCLVPQTKTPWPLDVVIAVVWFWTGVMLCAVCGDRLGCRTRPALFQIIF